MKSHRLLCFAAALTLAAPAASAETPPGFRLVLDYDGALVIKVLDLRIEQTVTADRFVSSARMKSYGVLSLFKRLDVKAQSTGRLRGDRPAPAQFRHSNMDGVFNRSVEVVWRPDEVTTSAMPGYPTPGDPAPTKAQKLGAADPLTALMRLAMPEPGASPCGRTARLFDGRQLYAVEIAAAAPKALTPRERSLGLADGVRCGLTFSEVAGFDAKPGRGRNQGLKGPLSIDFARTAEDGPWVITGLRGKTPLGEATVTIRAVRFEPSDAPRLIALN
jgi:hypothetical protein